MFASIKDFAVRVDDLYPPQLLPNKGFDQLRIKQTTSHTYCHKATCSPSTFDIRTIRGLLKASLPLLSLDMENNNRERSEGSYL